MVTALDSHIRELTELIAGIIGPEIARNIEIIPIDPGEDHDMVTMVESSGRERHFCLVVPERFHRLPENIRIATLCHELGHVLDYRTRSITKATPKWFSFLSGEFIRLECNADRLATALLTTADRSPRLLYDQIKWKKVGLARLRSERTWGKYVLNLLLSYSRTINLWLVLRSQAWTQDRPE